jgi:hypothetical protein
MLPAFYSQFVLGKHDLATAAKAQMWSHVAQWFRLASTDNNASESVVRVTPVEPATLPTRMALTNFAVCRIKELLGQVWFGGPGLTNAGFQAGVNLLRGTMTDHPVLDVQTYVRMVVRGPVTWLLGALLDAGLQTHSGHFSL